MAIGRGGLASICACALVLLAACGGGSGAEAPPGGLSQLDFQAIATAGIDDRVHSYPWAMTLFDGDGDEQPELYVGTWANALCLQSGRGTEPPPARWLCPNHLWDPTDTVPYLEASASPSVVYRGVPDGAGGFAWSRAWEPPLTEVAGFRGARVFEGALYLWSGLRQGPIWRSPDGSSFEAASPWDLSPVGGFRAGVVFRDRLYVASDSLGLLFASEDPSTDPSSWVSANSQGFVDSGGARHAHVFARGTVETADAASVSSLDIPELPPLAASGLASIRFTSGAAAGVVRQLHWNEGRTVYSVWGAQGTPFDPLPQPGDAFEVFNDAWPNNGPSWQLAVFDDHLYAVTANAETGSELWKSADPRPGNWTRVIEGAYGQAENSTFITLCAFGAHLYLTTGMTDTEDPAGCEVLRIDAADRVEVLVGRDRPPGTPGTREAGWPLSGVGAGFGESTNVYAWQAAVHDGWYYVGTYDVSGQARDVLAESPGGSLLGITRLDRLVLGPSGFDLWRTPNGLDWYEVTDDGFGRPDNYGVRNMASTPWGIVVGVANAVEGLELWLGR